MLTLPLSILRAFKNTSVLVSQSTIDFLMHIIPDTVVGAFANGEILQVLLFAILFGFALHKLGDAGRPVLKFIDQVAHVFFNIVNMVMKLAPIGAFGAMAFTIGKYGVGSLVQLGAAHYLLLYYVLTLYLLNFGYNQPY